MIDGLFMQHNGEGVVRERPVAKSKCNTGTLQPANHGRQTSHDWVERKLRQEREQQPDDATYGKVDELIHGGCCRTRLWTLRTDNGEIRINLQRVRSTSDKVEDLIDGPGTRVPVPPDAIRISAPRDSLRKDDRCVSYEEELAKPGAWR